MARSTSAGSVQSDPRSFRPDVEGLRALAILLVVAYHGFARYCPGGYVGVDVFFVISGFLITRQLVGEIEGTGKLSFLCFYARRARRILPAALLVTFVTVVVSAFVLSPLTARSVDTDALTASVFGMNYRLAILQANYLTSLAPTSPLQHYWSLSVEEQFYIVWPALLVLGSLVWGRRRSKRGVVTMLGAIAAASFAGSLWLTARSPTWAYYSIWTRAWELAAGGLVCLALPLWRRIHPKVSIVTGWAGLASIVAASLAFDNSTPFPGFAALAPVLGTAAVIVAGSGERQPRRGVESLLALRPSQALGRVSYSLYLWHFPALVFAPELIGHSLSMFGTAVVLFIALGLAVISYRLIEVPIRRMPRLVQQPSRGLVGGLGLIGATLGAVFLVTAALPSLVGAGAATRLVVNGSGLTLAGLQADLAEGLKTTAVPRNLVPSLADVGSDQPITYGDGCHVSYSSTTSPPCVFGDLHSGTTIVLFGDSHAAQWFPALLIIADQEHWRLVSLTKSGCPPPDVTVPHTPSGTAYPQCDVWRRYALRRIENIHPDLVITSWDRTLAKVATAEAGTPSGNGGVWLNGVAATLVTLNHAAKRVVLLSDTPLLAVGVPNCLSAHLTDAFDCTRLRRGVIDASALKRGEDRLATAIGVRVIDPTSWFCTETRCPVIVGNILVYRDTNHVTPQYTQFLAPVLRAALTG